MSPLKTRPPMWRSLEPAPAPPDPRETARLSRRGFLQLFGAGAAGVGLAACVRPPAQKILPYSRRPPELSPGLPLHYATALTQGGFARGVLVTCFEGRPVKVEGNPDHPASLGAAGVFELAATDLLYDPDLAQTFRKRGAPSASWLGFQREAFARADLLAKDGGARLRFLVPPSASPLLAGLRARLLERFPQARFHVFDAHGSSSPAQGAKLAFGTPLDAQLDFEAARVIVCLGADPLDGHPMALRYSRAFAAHREPGAGMNRLYVCEAAFTPTGTLADHRLALRPSEVEAMVWALLAELAALPAGAALSGLRPPAARLPTRPELRRWARAAAADLAAHPGEALIVAGPELAPEAHAAVHALNSALGAFDATVRFTAPVLADPLAGPESLAALVEELRAGAVDTLVVTADNPAFAAPEELGLGAALAKVPHAIYLGLYEDETAPGCEWFLPAAHAFESWGDARSFDGMASIVQPLIAPLYSGVTEAETLAAFLGESGRGAYALLRQSWQARRADGAFDLQWERWLADGVVPDSASSPVTAGLDLPAIARAVRELPAPPPPAAYELRLEPSRTIAGGRLANLPRLQELPEPIVKLTWGNAAILSPETARRLQVKTEEVVTLRRGQSAVELPALIAPGHADGCVTVFTGYGHRAAALSVARGVGVDVSPLRPVSGAPAPVQVAKAGRTAPLAVTQNHWTLEGRPHAPVITREELRTEPELLDELKGPLPTLYEPFAYPGHQWAMAIDLGRCTGCSACVLACVSENNIPAVGFAAVRNHREMQWLRVDRYFLGEAAAPKTVNQPMGCQHCRYAPCEYVCPVNATVHSDEGLNEQVYNRCVGTRYCSNNCPYKVRRFNFFGYAFQNAKAATQKMAMNPDVTVRSRGVMEKCTYCVQRIERARITARNEGRAIKEGEVVSACAQACPTEAIVFGDLADPASRVSRLQGQQRSYFVLHHQGTRPRNGYLARVVNPNPELAAP